MPVDVKDFESEVLKKSLETPVVVDFWAEWCAPCRILGSVLESLAEQANGDWVLAKLNTEEHPEIAGRYNVRGIPAVKMFVDGEVTNEFTGALPEFQVKSWLQQSLPSKLRRQIELADSLLAGGRQEEARRTLENVVREEPDNERARALLAHLLVFEDPRRAEELVSPIEVGDQVELAEAVRTVARLARFADDGGTLPEGEAGKLYSQAMGELLHQDFENALQHFIEVIRQDRYYDDDGSRKACIAIFKLLGEGHETTQKHRRDFSRALY